MKVTKDFYRKWHEDTKAMFREVEDEKAALSEDERSSEDEQSLQRFQKIWDKVKNAEKHTRYFRIPFRKQRFARLVKMAMTYAEDACADVTYETTPDHGFLRFEMDQVIIDDMRPEYWKVWRNLIRYADTFWVNTIEKYGEPALQFTFFIRFRRKIGIMTYGGDKFCRNQE